MNKRRKYPALTATSLDLPTPINLSYMWNFGSALGLILSLQILTGIILTIHYSPNITQAFTSVAHITRDVNIGWALRNIHANGASMFFVLIYIHILRGLIYISFKKAKPWMAGVTIYIATIATAFIGYLLPWGQMRFWGATVITNLFSAIPYFGSRAVLWIWGGYAVRGPTLTRFFTLHFLIPFIIALLSILHLVFLHETGSSGPLGRQIGIIKTPFHPHYRTKDTLGFIVVVWLLTAVSFFRPNIFTDPENFIPANPLVTPTHIKPEWYFLWAYAILRSIPNKLGGVVCMFSAILLLYLAPALTRPQTRTQMSRAYLAPAWSAILFTLLTWVGGCPVEEPFVEIGTILSVIYFAGPGLVIAIRWASLRAPQPENKWSHSRLFSPQQ